ncbi:hypothetical protein [Natronobacterium texcoconense]|uniref:DUF8173 domain-containing protein n=1 Tax=Natronobacterium texcoconense TaxID=1095778 RepID=A0A1H1INZ4_NATTX|nr:hypothetical protein [Natronobacterium texcoconense]SDR39414.1 hypothetical protein SAMN04489842_3676 [Natronobacterium texcoconense]
MKLPSTSTDRLAERSLSAAASLFGLAAVALVCSSTTVAAQTGGPEPTDTVPELPWFVEGITAGVMTLVIGGLLIMIAESTTRRVTDRALDEPGIAFLYGVGSLIAVIGSAFLLAITGIGIVIAVPLLLGYAIVALITLEFGYLATGRLVDDDWPVALAVAVVVSAVSGAVPVLGGIVAFVIGSIGIGAAIRQFLS